MTANVHTNGTEMHFFQISEKKSTTKRDMEVFHCGRKTEGGLFKPSDS